MGAATFEVTAAPAGDALLLDANSLSFWYDRREPPAVYSFGLRHARGILVIVGASGSGKSTLMRLLCGLISPAMVLHLPRARYCGAVRSSGVPLYGPSPSFSYVPQAFDLGLVPFLTVEENLLLAVSESGVSREEKERARSLLVRAGIGDLRGRPIRCLSGGQKQRVAICRALMTNPKIVFLDEPFANLDASLTPRMGDLLVDLRDKSELSVVVVTHDVRNGVRIADRVLGVRRGYAKPEYVEWSNELTEPGVVKDIERWMAS